MNYLRVSALFIFLLPSSVGSLFFLLVNFINPSSYQLVKLNRLIISLSVLAISLAVVLSNDQYIGSYISLFHALLYVLLACIIFSGKYAVSVALSVIKLFVLINFFALLAGYLIGAGLENIIFTSNFIIPRFRGFTAEPATIGIVLSWCIFILLKSSGADKWYYIGLSAVMILLTFSGSAFVLTAFAFAMAMRLGQVVFFGVLFLLSFSLALSLGLPGLEEIVLSRINNILDGNYNQSTFLRFISPILVATDFSNFGLMDFVFGSGVGVIENFLSINQNTFGYLETYKGEFVPQVNNSFAVIFVTFGAWGLFLFLSVLIISMKRTQDPKTHVLFILTLFFTGKVFSPIFWLLFLYTTKKIQVNE